MAIYDADDVWFPPSLPELPTFPEPPPLTISGEDLARMVPPTPTVDFDLSQELLSSDEEAEEMATSADLTWLNIHQNKRTPVPSMAEAKAYPYSEMEREFLHANRERLIVGSPETARRRILEIVEQTETREVMATTIIHDHQARRRSYELLCESFAPANFVSL